MMLDTLLLFLANLLPFDAPRRDPLVVAYESAYKDRRMVDRTEDDKDRLIAAMKRQGVPGIYTEPYGDRIMSALNAWDQDVPPRSFKRTLNRGI